MTVQHSILIINPGSTSSKVAVNVDGQMVDADTITHSSEVLSNYPSIWDQFAFRLESYMNWTQSHVRQCSAVIGIGGLLRPLDGGTYRINDKMLKDARANLQGEHASNLGCALAFELAKVYNCPSFIADPVSVDEFESLAFYSGHPEIKRRSLSHALNIHATARRAAKELELPYEKSSFVVCHLGGGISVAPVRNGKIIDANDASSDGPFSPERTGGLPLQPFITLCMSGKYSAEGIRKFVMGKGGLNAYLGTNSVKKVEDKIRSGDNKAEEVYQAMAYQIAKEIGSMATVLKGKLNAIVITGGIAHSKMLISWIQERVGFIAPVIVYPGEDEMQALAEAALRILNREEQAKEY